MNEYVGAVIAVAVVLPPTIWCGYEYVRMALRR
jgi:hypothetical protein